ncbi:hypothetical protein CsatB_008067 [Cannabis sativa]
MSSSCSVSTPLRTELFNSIGSSKRLIISPSRTFQHNEDVLSSVHQFRPNFLGISECLPCYYDPNDFDHSCRLMSCHLKVDSDALEVDDENSQRNVLQYTLC